MRDRFDLEHDIMQLFATADDLDLLCEAVIDDEMSSDEIANALGGLCVLAKLRASRVFETFKETLQLDEYNDKFSS